MPADAAKPKRAATVTRRYGGVDAAERRRERQRKLIDAGLDIFGSKGYHLATVRDVCSNAGLSERYFYETYKTLGELFDAVYAELRRAVQQRVMAAIMTQGAVSIGNPLAMGESSMRAWLGFIQEDPRRARIMLVDAMGVSESGVRSAETAVNEMKSLLRTFITMLYPALQRADFELDLIVSGLTGSTIYIAKAWAQSGFKQPLDHIVQHNMLFYRAMDEYHKRLVATGEPLPALDAAPLPVRSKARASTKAPTAAKRPATRKKA
jgi:AcrR family transcriptional regulator